jgi:hypothetical protein
MKVLPRYKVGLKHETQQMPWVALPLNPTKQKMDKVLFIIEYYYFGDV